MMNVSLPNYLPDGEVMLILAYVGRFGHLVNTFPVTRAIALPTVIGLVKLAVLDHCVIHSESFSDP